MMNQRNAREWMEREQLRNCNARNCLQQISSPIPLRKIATRTPLQFHEQHEEYPPLFEIDVELSKILWYSQSELSGIKEEARNTLRAFRRAGCVLSMLNEEEVCLRGLEDWGNPGGLNEKKTRVHNIIHGILEEQANQRQMRINDPKGLQVLSCACSKYAKERALDLGRNDEEEMRSRTRRMSMSLPELVKKDSDSKLEGSGSCPEVLSASLTKLALTREQINSSSARSA